MYGSLVSGSGMRIVPLTLSYCGTSSTLYLGDSYDVSGSLRLVSSSGLRGARLNFDKDKENLSISYGSWASESRTRSSKSGSGSGTPGSGVYLQLSMGIPSS